MRSFPGVPAAVLLICCMAASAIEIGDWVVVVKPVDLKPRHGSGTRLTPGTCVRVLELNTQSAYVSVGRVGNVERTAVLPLEEGLERFSKAVTNDPKDASCWFARAKIFFHRRELDKAIADLDRGLMLSRDNSEAYTTRGFAWKAKGDDGRAMTDLSRAIELDPLNALAWRIRGATWASKADYPKALADYSESIRIDPDNPDSLNHRVVMLSACKDDKIRNGKQAVADATRACELTDWRIALYMSNLGIAYAEAGDFESAIKWHKRAMELSGADIPAAMKSRLDQYRNHEPFRMTWR